MKELSFKPANSIKFQSFSIVLLLLFTFNSVFADSFSDNFNNGVVNSPWHTFQNGCNVSETAGQLRIQGTTVQSGWGFGSGIRTDRDFLGGNFDVSADFSVPQFSGPGTRLIYLQAESSLGMVGLFYSVGSFYRVQTWNPSQFSSTLPAFGDEDTAFHRMRLAYDSQQSLLTGYIDNSLIGSLAVQMSGNIGFTLQAVSETSGMVIDTRFDNFSLAPEPATLLLLALGGLFLKRKR